MGRIIDLAGQKFGRLTALSFSHKDRHHKSHWVCNCICGKTKIIAGSSLRRNLTTSCGCFHIEGLKSAYMKKCISEANKRNGMWVGKNNPGYGKVGTLNNSNKKEVRDKIALSKFGSMNPAWKGGIAHEPYCSIFFDKEFKHFITYRDHYTCQYCGITRMLSFKVFGKNLNIHHIDYNKKNCKLNNLITLCQRCNSKANHNRSFWQHLYQCKMATLV